MASTNVTASTGQWTSLHQSSHDVTSDPEETQPQPAVKTNNLDPIVILTLTFGLIGAAFSISLGTGGWNQVPNFGFGTWRLMQDDPGTMNAALVVIANMISIFLSIPVTKAISVYLRRRFGLGYSVEVNDIKIWTAVINNSLFSWDGAKALIHCFWASRIASILLAGSLMFLNALIVPMLTQNWAWSAPSEISGTLISVPTFNESTVRIVLQQYSTTDVSLLTDQLSTNKINLSYLDFVQAAIHAFSPSAFAGVTIYAAAGRTAWMNWIPPIPYPIATISGIEDAISSRDYSSCSDCVDIATHFTSAGLEITTYCQVYASSATGVTSEQYSSQLALDLSPQPWRIGCNVSVSGVGWTVQKNRNNGTGWSLRIDGSNFDVDQSGATYHINALAKIIVAQNASLFRYNDITTASGRSATASSIEDVFSNALAGLYFSVFFFIYHHVSPRIILPNTNRASHGILWAFWSRHRCHSAGGLVVACCFAQPRFWDLSHLHEQETH